LKDHHYDYPSLPDHQKTASKATLDINININPTNESLTKDQTITLKHRRHPK
jgi:hypothetical protein